MEELSLSTMGGIARRLPLVNQESGITHNWTTLAFSSWTSSLQDCETRMFVVLNHPVCGILL